MNCNMNYQSNKQIKLNTSNLYVVKCKFKQLQNIKNNNLSINSKIETDLYESIHIPNMLKKKLNL